MGATINDTGRLGNPCKRDLRAAAAVSVALHRLQNDRDGLVGQNGSASVDFLARRVAGPRHASAASATEVLVPSLHRLLLGLIVASHTLLAAASASATVDVSGSGDTSLDAGATTVPFDFTYADNTAVDGSKAVTGQGFLKEATLTVPEVISAYAGGGGSAYAAPGVLRASAGGHAFIVGIVPYDPRVTTSFGASFTDQIQLGGAGLAPGTPVTYHGTITISTEQHGAYYYSGFGYPTGTFFLQYAVGANVGAFYSFPVAGFSNLPDLHFEIPFDVSGSVGDVVPISCSLALGTQDRANSGFGYDQSTAFDGNPGVHFRLQPVTPGLVLTSDSGHDYTVPEPTGGCFVAASALLAVASRRRWTSRRSRSPASSPGA
jgi:hypothetical protein